MPVQELFRRILARRPGLALLAGALIASAASTALAHGPLLLGPIRPRSEKIRIAGHPRVATPRTQSDRNALSVLAYYRSVDRIRAGDSETEIREKLADVIAPFASDAEYQRDSARYSGIGEIEDFFARIRRLRGRHVITSIEAEDNHVRVAGQFSGVADGVEPVEFGWVDYWIFNADGKVSFRESRLQQEGL